MKSISNNSLFSRLSQRGALALIPLLAGPASAATLLYENSFTTEEGSIQPLADVSWQGYQGSSSLPATPTSESGVPNRAGSFGGANGALDDYIFVQNQSTAVAGLDYFLSTTAVTAFAPSAYTGVTASWQRNGEAMAGYHFSVQTGGQWYVSQTTYTNSMANPSFNLTASTWVPLILIEGTGGSLDRGTTVSTFADLFGSGQTITGVGYYVDDLSVAGTNRTLRIDNVQIIGIPEPRAVALAGLGMVTMGLRRKRSGAL